MQTTHSAIRAYGVAASHRGPREQEAEMFRNVNAALRRARDGGTMISRVRALADNDLLWITVIGVASDPSNRLPPETRAGLVSIGLAVQREMQRETPDFEFLLTVNDNVASGLAVQG